MPTATLETAPIVAAVPLWMLQHLAPMVFVFCFGACVGSFMNVVIYRLPAGMSVISPPSRCPTCGARLRFFRENLPIVGWLMIRGRCRYCGVKVSPQYAIIETLVALIFVGLYAVLFMTSQGTAPTGQSWWGQVGGQWWQVNGLFRVWPAYLALAFMITGLIAMTVIDARTFTIPIEIPLFLTMVAFIAYPLQALLPHRAPWLQTWPIPAIGWTGSVTAIGGMIGIVVALILLRIGWLPLSFADYAEYVEEGETLGDYPHARREMWAEIRYLTPCLLGVAAGHFLGRLMPVTPPPVLIQAVGATFLGYLVGGGLIWGIRILGTLGFGREAMGLGDVHLLASVGAVLGWFDPIWIFFIAPFSGILWVLVSMGLSSVLKTARRELPYGPHLAVATLAVVLARPAVNHVQAMLLPGVTLPRPGLVAPPAAPSPPGWARPSGPRPTAP